MYSKYGLCLLRLDMWNGNVSWQNTKNQIQSAVSTPNGWNKDVANPFQVSLSECRNDFLCS